jgi:hypothetical protein
LAQASVGIWSGVGTQTKLLKIGRGAERLDDWV